MERTNVVIREINCTFRQQHLQVGLTLTGRFILYASHNMILSIHDTRYRSPLQCHISLSLKDLHTFSFLSGLLIKLNMISLSSLPFQHSFSHTLIG